MHSKLNWKHVAIVGIVCASIVAGCTTVSNARSPETYGKIIRMDNGRKVECVVIDTTAGAGVTCDWNNK